jgi:hypothetical protein
MKEDSFSTGINVPKKRESDILAKYFFSANTKVALTPYLQRFLEIRP